MKRMMTLLMFALLAVGSFVLAPTASYAAPATGAVAEGPILAQTALDTKLKEITDLLTSLGRPLAGLALILVVLTYIAEPALPDMARENKGMMRKVLFSALILGLIPDIVSFFMGAA